MCGICGIFFQNRDWRVPGDVLARMNRSIVHRGPDDEGFFVEENVGLAMRRLSIIDVKSGHQPLANEKRDVWIVFNGEIYNHAELRVDLEAKGHEVSRRLVQFGGKLDAGGAGADDRDLKLTRP